MKGAHIGPKYYFLPINGEHLNKFYYWYVENDTLHEYTISFHETDMEKSYP